MILSFVRLAQGGEAGMSGIGLASAFFVILFATWGSSLWVSCGARGARPRSALFVEEGIASQPCLGAASGAEPLCSVVEHLRDRQARAGAGVSRGRVCERERRAEPFALLVSYVRWRAAGVAPRAAR